MEARLGEAGRKGRLNFFSEQYRAQRLAAPEAGVKFMPYNAEKFRLQQAITGKLVGDTRSLIEAVFEPLPASAETADVI